MELEAVDVDGDGFAKGARPLCPFCSKPWSAHMMDQAVEASAEEGYYGGIESISAVIDIHCDGCARLIYRKEVQAYGSKL